MSASIMPGISAGATRAWAVRHHHHAGLQVQAVERNRAVKIVGWAHGVLFIIFYFNQNDQNSGSGFIYALAAVGLLVVLVFFKNRLTAPAILHGEQLEEINHLSSEVGRLKDDAEPRLNILYDLNKPMFEYFKGDSRDEKGQRLFRIAVVNEGNSFLKNCCVKLFALEPSVDLSLPATLKQRQDNPNDVLNIPHKQDFSLYPKTQMEMDVASLVEAFQDTKIQLHFALESVS
jgi:hypothetical protein